MQCFLSRVFIYLDIDECGIDNSGCHANANCQNTVGSFSFTCKSGYDGMQWIGLLWYENIPHGHSDSFILIVPVLNTCNDVLDFNLEIEIVVLVLF